jgi:predicted membrane-bound spermidine synthase
MTGLAALFLILSGCAALAYQVVWVRLLGLTLGSTAASVSTVLAAFFLGIALGSALAPRLGARRDLLRVYLTLEAVIGVSGSILLYVLLDLDRLIAALPFEHVAFEFTFTFLLLLVPTVCMGASFPVLASHVLRRPGQIGSGLGLLYAANTAGAVIGAALSGFWLIPRWGLDGANLVAAGLNFTIVALGAAFARAGFLSPPGEEPPSPAPDRIALPAGRATSRPRDRRAALLVLAVTGFSSIATEVGWTKYLVLFTGGTVYGFATILTVFLAGIALGSWAVRSRLDAIERPRTWLVGGLIALGLSLLLTRGALTFLPDALELVNGMEGGRVPRLLARFGVVAAVLSAPTLLFGALFPLTLSVYCGGATGVRSHLGRAYAVNTVAGVLGSLCAGFWLIPRYGTNALLTATALGTLLLALLLVSGIPSPRTRFAAVTTTLVGCAIAWIGPALSFEELIGAVRYPWDEAARSGVRPSFLYLREGRTGVISVVTYDGRTARLQNNGLNESIVDLDGTGGDSLTESLLGLVPWLLHEDPRSCFVVGYGGGVTVRALERTDLERIRVVELEPTVVEAVRSVWGARSGLDDERIELVYDDARHDLLVGEGGYDLVVSQPSHPWLAGASPLFTEEFFRLVRSRLSEGGVCGQWLNLFNMDVTTLRSLTATFYAVFPHGFTLAVPESGDLLFFGSRYPIRIRPDLLETRMTSPGVERTLSACGIRDRVDLLRRFAWSRREAVALSAGSRRNTDRNVLSEVRLAALNLRRDAAPPAAEDPYAFLRDHASFDLEPLVEAGAAPRVLTEVAERLIELDERRDARSALERLAHFDVEQAAVLEERLVARGRARAPDPRFPE